MAGVGKGETIGMDVSHAESKLLLRLRQLRETIAIVVVREGEPELLCVGKVEAVQ